MVVLTSKVQNYNIVDFVYSVDIVIDLLKM